MKIAFDPTVCPVLDFVAAADLARRCGFDGLQLPAHQSAASATNAILTAPLKIRRILEGAGVHISAIDTGPLETDSLPQCIALAAELHCPLLRTKSDSLFTRSGTTPQGMIDQLLRTADLAASAGVSIVIENQPTAGSALRLWHLLDRLNHPSIACCWNTLTAARAGDLPAVAVPLLNSRIRYVHLQDARGSAPCNLADGTLPLRKTTDRLHGIGFEGCLLVGTAPGQDPAQFEQSLLAGCAVLQQWQILPTPITAKKSISGM
jgi:sugar phosphate isomerase/epimerase